MAMIGLMILIMANGISSLSQSEADIPRSKTWTKTETNVVKFSHKWTIDNFSYYHSKVGDKLHSSTFSAGLDDDVKWRMDLYPNGDNETSKDNLSLFLILVAPNFLVYAWVELAILNAQGGKAVARPLTNAFSEQLNGWGYNNFSDRNFVLDPAKNVLSEDKLTLLCEGSYIVPTDGVFGPSSRERRLTVPQSRIVQDVGSLLESKSLSDVVLDVCGVEYYAHRAILSARSSVFAAMCADGAAGRKPIGWDNTIYIEPCMDLEVFEEMLRFVYTDGAAKLEHLAGDLLAAANRYDLPRLKAMCGAALLAHITTENSWDVLKLADENGADELKSLTMEFIEASGKNAIDTSSFKSMIDSHPRVAAEFLWATMMNETARSQ